MSNNLTSKHKISEGIISRYVKPSCIVDNNILNETFDLRDGKPPETYISFFMVDNTSADFFTSAVLIIKTKIPKFNVNGAITLLDIKEVIDEINDEEDDIIGFFDKNLPHCGLEYMVNDLTKIQEAKTTLSFLAKKKFALMKDIETMEQLKIEKLLK